MCDCSLYVCILFVNVLNGVVWHACFYYGLCLSVVVVKRLCFVCGLLRDVVGVLVLCVCCLCVCVCARVCVVLKGVCVI